MVNSATDNSKYRSSLKAPLADLLFQITCNATDKTQLSKLGWLQR